MSQKNKPSTTSWSALEQGRSTSFGSLGSIVEDDQTTETGSAPQSYAPGMFAPRVLDEDQATPTVGNTGGRRRSSFTARVRQMGGPNNLDNFFASYQRAAGYRSITPVRRGSVSFSDDGTLEQPDTRRRSARPQLESLLSQQILEIQAHPPTRGRQLPDRSQSEEVNDTSALLTPPATQNFPHVRSRLDSVRSSQVDDYGMSYGSISSRISKIARQRAQILIDERIEASQRARDLPEEYKDDAPVEEDHVEVEELPDGEIIERIVGESTVPQTIFNSTNVLIGVGILALPLAFRYAGWVIGVGFLSFAAVVTAYTALILAKCLDTNTAATTYGDIAFLAFGTFGRSLVEVLFILELVAANVALIILFGDSMNSLLPSIGVLYWKILIAVGLIPVNFVPFRTLSVTSILGIVCVAGIIISVLVNGLLKPHAPGSLRQVATTYAFPENFKTLPLSFGLFMAPWGGHSVFPAVYKDMRHPKKYIKAVRATYVFTYSLDLAMGVVGYLMFGEKVLDEITSNILYSKAYAHVARIIIVILIASIPISKIPLTNRPIMDTLNKKFLIDPRQMDAKARAFSEKNWKHRLGRIGIGVFVNLLQLGVAIGVPDFDSVMALMGSSLCFTICVILPVSFYLKIFWGGGAIGVKERILCFVLVIIAFVLGATGTVFAVLPRDKIGVNILAR